MLLNYWGKSGEEGQWHPLIYHQLDISATGITLLDLSPQLENRLQVMSGIPSKPLREWIAFFFSIHDLGKFSSAFQQLRIDLCSNPDQQYFYNVRHDTLGHLLWRKKFAYDDDLQNRLVFWPDTSDDPIELIDTWVQCVTGHHGQPPELISTPIADYFSNKDIAAAREWIETAANLFLPDTPGPNDLSLVELEQRMGAFSWYLAGMCTLADWLGSNRDYFPYCIEPLEPAQYLEQHAIPNARRAVGNSGLLPATTARFSGVSALFDFIREPTPLQSACLKLPIANGPQLHILEDVTGAGKTEAAFILLARIMASGQAQGAYIALPTMATANAMYGRTASVYRKLFRSESALPSLVLAHGARKLDQRFRDSVIHPESLPAEGEYSRDEFDAEARCNSWLADNNKKALLAQVGVGTIDQALLAVLQSRHQSLRLVGLIGKVLIVDEVHASDAYMHTLLCQLLTMHAQAGGSAILLSATLPGQMRDDLLRTFGADLSTEAPQPEKVAYPLLTSVVPSAAPIHRPVATRDSVRRCLNVEMFHDQDQTLDWIVQQASQGLCVAWVRNTVNDAIDAWLKLSEALGEERATLFHARFAMGDRLDIERDVLAAFGPGSTADTRYGRVVVATQVIEQSLDLDFDEMVSDLAPIDLLIQRAGRLKRHLRDACGNRLQGQEPDQRQPPRLHVLSPEPDCDADAGWIRRLLPGTGAVYPDHGQLWLTAWEISQRKQIRAPEDFRSLIESVYGDAAREQTPEPLQASSSKAEGKAYSDRSVARLNAIKIANGYTRSGGQWLDDSYAPTRLGDPTVTIRLARWQSGVLMPWYQQGANSWSLSEVRLAARAFTEPSIDDPDIAAEIERVRDGWPRANRHTPILPLRRDGEQWLASALDASGRIVQYQYCPESGLQKRKENTQ